MRAGPALLVRVGVLLLLLAAAIGTSADADLWGHVRFGQDILQTGSVSQVDDYSFTSDRPWINHEWLSEVAFAEAYRFGGSAGLVLLKLIVIAALLTLVWWHVKAFTTSVSATLGVVVLTFAGSYWRTHSIRPQLFSVLLFAIVLVLVARADAGRRGALVVMPLVMALWVNLHGGWIVGLAVFGFWAAARLLDRRLRLRSRVAIAAVALMSAGATLANPYGVGLWRFMVETVGFNRSDIQDWNSVIADPIRLGLLWGLVVLVGVAAVVRTRPRMDYSVIAGLTALAAFRVSRLDAFLTLVVAILLMPPLLRSWPSMAPAEGRASTAGVAAITVVTVLAMTLPAFWIFRPYVGCATVGGAWAPDAAASRFMAVNRLEGRLLTWFDWGEYALWHFGPRLKVSIDGRRETVYSERTLQAHRRLYAADASAAQYLLALNPDYIWLPTGLPIVSSLKRTGWIPIFDGRTSVVFARTEHPEFTLPVPSSDVIRCFPGP